MARTLNVQRGFPNPSDSSPFNLHWINLSSTLSCCGGVVTAMSLPPDDSLAWKVWLGSIVSVVAATIAVAARLLARRISAAPFWWDDWTIMASLAVQWGMGISRWIILVDYYYGHHAIYVGAHRLALFQKAFVGIQSLYFLNAVLTKTSLLFLYYRIFGVVKFFRYSLLGTGFAVWSFWAACTILAFLGCTPFARNWDKTIAGHCVDLVAFFRWNGICNLALDFLILLLPLPMVWRLNVSVRQRLELSSVFLLGVFVCVTSVMRIISYSPSHLKDNTYWGVGSMTWSGVEQGIGIVCACLPTLRPLLLYIYPKGTKNSKRQEGSSVSMDNFHRSGIVHSEITAPGKSAWEPAAYDSESTVGFARLQDDEGILSPADVQRSVYAPIGAAISTTAGGGDRTTKIVPAGILKEQTMDQRSEVL